MSVIDTVSQEVVRDETKLRMSEGTAGPKPPPRRSKRMASSLAAGSGKKNNRPISKLAYGICQLVSHKFQNSVLPIICELSIKQ